MLASWLNLLCAQFACEKLRYADDGFAVAVVVVVAVIVTKPKRKLMSLGKL